MKLSQWSTEKKLAIVLEGLKGQKPVVDICREHDIHQALYYKWHDQFFEGARQALGNFGNTILRPAWVEVDLDAIAYNVQQIKNFIGDKALLAIVKTDAYGLGAVPVSKVVLENGARYLGVVTLDEAIELRQAGINAPILNMGEIMSDQAPYVIEYNLEQMVYQIKIAEALSKVAGSKGKKAKLHFKIDTGMNRYGVHYTEAIKTFTKLASLPNLDITGVMTHFAASGRSDSGFTLLQIHRFQEIRTILEQKGYRIPLWHASSSGTLDLKESHLDAVRVGLMMYGYYPSNSVQQPFPLKPAMSVKAKIVAIRKVLPGDTVGYGRRFVAEKEEDIAVLPIGYADGYDRRLSQIGQILCKGKKVPIVGMLCMDCCFLKVTDIPHIQVGAVVTLMGRQGKGEISPLSIANLIETNSYEVISRFGKKLPRIYKRGRQVIEVHKSFLKSG